MISPAVIFQTGSYDFGHGNGAKAHAGGISRQGVATTKGLLYNKNLIGDCVRGKQSQADLGLRQQEAGARLKQLNGCGATRRAGLAAAEVHAPRQLESDPCHLAVHLPLHSTFQVPLRSEKVTKVSCRNKIGVFEAPWCSAGSEVTL